MTDEVVSKRLIISGLTPAVTPDALRNRLLSFGNVRNLDGFGALDGNGECSDLPRWEPLTSRLGWK